MTSLLDDDQCRVCFHTHPYPGPCNQDEHDPGPDGTCIISVCVCEEYVDLEAESRIVVKLDDPR
jgi:hypothetical protein